MRARVIGAVVGASALVGSLALAGGTAGASSAVQPSPGQGTGTAGSTPAADYVAVCGAVPAGYARCHSDMLENPAKNWQGQHVSPSKGPGPSPNTTPAGYGPADLRSAYALSGSGASTQTIGIVDAYNDPNAESDLGVYRSQFGLPACTTANGCFKKVNQNGGQGSYPRSNGGWAQEISLDLDMASAICPNCHILLVEASSNSFANLGAAENQAVASGATVISNSWGGGDSSSDSTYDAYFNHPGTAITASTGDSGYGAEYPATSKDVTAAGGTTLKKASNTRGWSETVWSKAGSGCSSYEAQPGWQSTVSNITSVCGNRAEADVSAVADPNTGVAVYDSYSYMGMSGWLVFGGTSVASPIIASVYALAGNAASVNYGSYPYSHTSSLFDVTSGSNGSCGTLLCNGATGWDGPTGLGTPNGAGAF